MIYVYSVYHMIWTATKCVTGGDSHSFVDTHDIHVKYMIQIERRLSALLGRQSLPHVATPEWKYRGHELSESYHLVEYPTFLA